MAAAGVFTQDAAGHSRLDLPDWSTDLGAGALAYVNRTGITQIRVRFATGDNDDLSADYLTINCTPQGYDIDPFTRCCPS